jgi:glyoxylase I family protein
MSTRTFTVMTQHSAGLGARRGSPTRLAYHRPIERVTGIGGFFFRARDPEGLARWYFERLGVTPVPSSYDAEVRRQQAGETVFAPFPQDSEMIGRPEHTWMINFRVDDLDAIVAQLRAAGETVDVDPERYPNGRFATLRDPEGNGIQLWEPMDAERSGLREEVRRLGADPGDREQMRIVREQLAERAPRPPD